MILLLKYSLETPNPPPPPFGVTSYTNWTGACRRSNFFKDRLAREVERIGSSTQSVR